MKLKTLLVFFLSGLLAFALNVFAANATNSKILDSIKTCLPVAEAGTPFQNSIAGYADIKPSRWILVRALHNPILAPSYSVVEIKNQTCKNYHRYPVQDISRAFIPKPVINRFKVIIKSDLDIAWKRYEQSMKRLYPGKSEQELRRMGVYGMDNL